MEKARETADTIRFPLPWEGLGKGLGDLFGGGDEVSVEGDGVDVKVDVTVTKSRYQVGGQEPRLR